MKIVITALLLTSLAAWADDPYSTSFNYDESPLSDSDQWVTCGTPWPVVETTTNGNGIAFGTQDNVDDAYDDSCALLAPSTLGANQMASAVVYAGTFDEDCNHEVELQLRGSVDGDQTFLYECLFPVNPDTDNDRALFIGRWNGDMGDFSTVCSGEIPSPIPALDTGDVVRCAVFGTTFTMRINGALVLGGSGGGCTDSTYSSGQPGIGFFRRHQDTNCSGSANNNMGFLSFTAKTLVLSENE